MTTHVPQKVPEHFSRVDIGAYMRELRQHYGLSEQEVSERLHIRMRYVTAIEEANFDAMPGKAYARGYVHTYAEFLGLDADQIVERCFGGEMAREVQAHSIPESSNWYKRNKAYGGVLAVLLLLAGLFYFATQADRTEGETAQLAEGVESVPEEYLTSMRTRLMPTARNYECLGLNTPLGCYFNQRITQQWVKRAPLPAMAPAPASAFDEVIDEDDDKEEADAQEQKPKAEVKKPAPKPAAKPAVTKPVPKKKETNEKFPGMPANYKGYYVPPKPEPQPVEETPAPEAEDKKPEAYAEEGEE